MANLKSIVDLPLSDNLQDLGFIVNDNGQAKQIKENFATYQDIENIEQDIENIEQDIENIEQIISLLDKTYYVVCDGYNNDPVLFITPGTYDALYNSLINKTPISLVVMENARFMPLSHFWQDDEEKIKVQFLSPMGNYTLIIHPDNTAFYLYES